MNWEAMGAIGEIVGAIAVVTTLIVLIIQLRQNTRSMDEANYLQKSAAIDKHAESIGSWRNQFISDENVAKIWCSMRDGKDLSQLDAVRFDNIWVNFVNTQRSNFIRANVVGEPGLARQAVLSVVVELASSDNFLEGWKATRHWNQLVSPDFVTAVEQELKEGSPNAPGRAASTDFKRGVLEPFPQDNHD